MAWGIFFADSRGRDVKQRCFLSMLFILSVFSANESSLTRSHKKNGRWRDSNPRPSDRSKLGHSPFNIGSPNLRPTKKELLRVLASHARTIIQSATTGVTVFLALSVFSLVVADKLPETSAAVPLIGSFPFLSTTDGLQDRPQTTHKEAKPTSCCAGWLKIHPV